jgi:hypothetical protein
MSALTSIRLCDVEVSVARMMGCPPKTGPRNVLESSHQWEEHDEGKPVFKGADHPSVAAGREWRRVDQHTLPCVPHHEDHLLPPA